MALYRPFAGTSLFGDLFHHPFLRTAVDDYPGTQLTSSRGWANGGIRADVHEHPDKYVVEAEVPGVAKDAVKIEVDQSEATPRLRISASFKQSYESPELAEGSTTGTTAATKKDAGNGDKQVKQQQQPQSRVLLSERSYGSFSRTYSLPDNADWENIKATQKEGLLSITIPKRTPQEKQPRQITIESA